MQIAGDLLPNGSVEDLIATAVHRLTQTNEEGGTDDEEFRTAAVVDRINTTWQVWQGLTFGCAQCHDHPYDPFRHEDYYSFMAFWNNTADWDLDQEFPIIQVPSDKRFYAEASTLDRDIRNLNQSIWEREYEFVRRDAAWQPLVGMKVSSKETQTAIEPSKPNEFHAVGTVARDTDYAISWTAEPFEELNAIRLTLKPLEPNTAILNTEVGTVLSHVRLESRSGADPEWHEVELERLIADEPEPFFDPNGSLDSKKPQGFGAFARIQRDRQTAILLKQPLLLGAKTELRLTLSHRMFVLDAFPLVSKRVAIDTCYDSIVQLSAPELVDWRNQLTELRTKRAAIPSVSLPVVRELVPHLRRPTHVFIRGFFLTKDKQVELGLPTSMLHADQRQPKTRSELADWMVSDENPLTARVHVNRIWARLFGRGIVVSEEDFGSSGDLPNHQELLDDLAIRFQHRYAWSQKRLIRELVLSATFRQSHHASEESRRFDPDNRWMARGPRHRLPAEVIRDSTLWVAGLLNTSQGGPPTHPPIPDGVWLPFQAGDKWNTPDVGKAERYRRSVYTYTKRSIPYPMLSAFDAPSREFCTARRMPSNTPVQALMALNDITFTEAARAICIEEGLVGESTIEEPKLRRLWQRILGREPSLVEQSQVVDYWEKCRNESDSEVAWERVALLLFNHDEMLAN
jgi:hypothetical protein